MSSFLIWFGVVVGALYIASCLTVYAFQERFIFFPTKLPEDYYYRFPLTFEEHDIEVEKDSCINALLFKADNSKGCVLYHHGNARSVLDWGSNAHDFVSRGYDVLFYDYRGYGKSDGEISSEAQLVEDGRKVYRWLLTKYSPDKIIQMGRSLGSGLAVQLAVEFNSPKLILETPYSSIVRIARRTMPFLPVKLLLKYKMMSLNHVQNFDGEIYSIHGTNDKIIPIKHSKTLSKKNKRVKLITIKGGDHNNLPSFEEYQKAFDLILD